MKKLIGLLVLVITFSLVGFQSYSQREGRADFASLQNRVQTTRATLVQRDVAIKTLHTALMQTNEAIVRDSARLDAFEAKHRGGISDYQLYRDYKKRVSDLNAAMQKYNTMYAQWDVLDRRYNQDVRAFNLMADSVGLASATLDSTESWSIQSIGKRAVSAVTSIAAK